MKSAKVAIVLATFNGERFLQQQLDSFTFQSHLHWTLHVSDDGSTDNTVLILKKYAKNFPVHIHNGPRIGYAKNFLSLISKHEIVADFIALSDQDDIWHKDKLKRAIAALNNVSPDTPALYCSRTRLIDDNNNLLDVAPLFLRPPSFANALVQVIGGGNTMVLNKAAHDILKSIDNSYDIVSHDWWIYQFISGIGGHIIYDPEPTVDYRQHSNNLIGTNRTIKARLNRLKQLINGEFRSWNIINCKSLKKIENLLTVDAKSKLESFDIIQNGNLFNRIIEFRRSGIHRQDKISNIALLLAVIAKKI